MGFFAWVRRALPATSAGPVPGDGAPAALPDAAQAAERRRGPVDRARPGVPAAAPAGPAADVPAPLSARRLTDWFAAQGYSWFVDGDGDVGSLWRGRPFWFLCLGARKEILQVRGQWHRDIAIERLTEVLELCNDWNTDRLWPKAYVRVRDDGTVHVTCEVATDLEHGVTDDQLSDLLHCGIGSALALFDELDARYPDPVSHAP